MKTEKQLASDLENYSKNYHNRIWFTVDEFSKATNIDKKELSYYLFVESKGEHDIIIRNTKDYFSTRNIYKERSSFSRKFIDIYTYKFN